jgi:hypothetical protein
MVLFLLSSSGYNTFELPCLSMTECDNSCDAVRLSGLHCALMSFVEQDVCVLRCGMGEEEGEEVAMSPEASRRITSIASSVAEQVDRAVCAAVQAISPGQIQSQHVFCTG